MLGTSLGIVIWAWTIANNPFRCAIAWHILDSPSIVGQNRLILLNKAAERSWCWSYVDSHYAPANSLVPTRATVIVPRPAAALLSL